MSISATGLIELMLWKRYEYTLPSAPRDMAREIVAHLEANGYRLVKEE